MCLSCDRARFRKCAAPLDHISLKFSLSENPEQRQREIRKGDQGDRPGNRALSRASVHDCANCAEDAEELDEGDEPGEQRRNRDHRTW